MDTEIVTRSGATVVAVKGRMDALTSPEFDKALSGADLSNKVLLQLSGLEYISSAGLRSLLVLAKRLKEREGELLCCALQKPVEEVFRISGFHSLFKVYATEEEALAQIARS